LTTVTIILLLSAILFAAFIVWMLLRSYSGQKQAVANDRLQQQYQVLVRLQTDFTNLKLEKESLQQQYIRTDIECQFLNEQNAISKRYQKENEILQNQLALFKAKFQAAEEKLETQKKEMQELGDRFRSEFRNLAQSILEEKTQKFTLLNEEKMNAILTPLKAQLVDFKQKVEDTYDKESKERFSLGREVQRLIEMSQLVSQEASNLTTALKGNNKIQGNWGEMILESLLENSGLTKGREYFVQEFIKDNAGNIIRDENGKGLQPDITIYYPDQRKVIIDSKVSLVAWEQYIGSDDADTQKKFLLEHTLSMRNHIDELGRKNYPKYAGALDYVLLFIPIEPAFLEAVKTDGQMWKYAYDRKILLVSPTNLFAVLKIVADLWKVERQNRHAVDIAEKAGALYDKFTGFLNNLETVGKKITEASNAYETAFKQMATGRGNIINRVEELKKMGANAQNQLPDRLFVSED